MVTKKNFFELIEDISKSRNVSIEDVERDLIVAIEKAYLKENPETNIKVVINSAESKFEFAELKTVVEDNKDDIDDDIEITLSEAKKIKNSAKLNDIIEIKLDISKFDRMIALHIKQVFSQKLNEGSNNKVYDEWADKIGMNIRAEVETRKQNSVEVNLNDTVGVVLRKEQIPGENLEPGSKYIFYIKNVQQQTKGWPIILSRADAGLVENLLRNEIAEIEEGKIEIKAIARIPGMKTKVAVKTHDPNIDPVGTCVGPGGLRVKEIMQNLNGEHIDIILWDDDPKQFLVNACSPEKIYGLEITDDEDSTDGRHKFVTIIVEDEVLPKVIGRKGMNIKLISKLTNWSIDIQTLSIAKEDQIEYEDVSHMTPTRHNRNNNGNWQRSIRNFDERNNANKKGKPFGKKEGEYNSDFSFINTHSNKWSGSKKTESYNSSLITDDDIDQILNFGSAPQKTKPVNIELNEDDLFDNNKKTFDNSNYKKSKPKKSKKEEENLFDEFDDITEKDLNNDDTAKNINLDILEFDEE
ncbi:MAG: transcription termination factor NusA [Mycoplasmoidaceae bacterium]